MKNRKQRRRNNCRERYQSRPVERERLRLGAVVNNSIVCNSGVLGQPFAALLLGHDDVHDGLSSILEGLEVNLDIRWEEHFGVPGEALACSDVGDLKVNNGQLCGLFRWSIYDGSIRTY